MFDRLCSCLNYGHARRNCVLAVDSHQEFGVFTNPPSKSSQKTPCFRRFLLTGTSVHNTFLLCTPHFTNGSARAAKNSTARTWSYGSIVSAVDGGTWWFTGIKSQGRRQVGQVWIS